MSEYEFDVLCQNINITIFSKSDGNLQFKKQGILQDIHSVSNGMLVIP